MRDIGGLIRSHVGGRDGERRELAAPLADRLLRHYDASGQQQLFDIPHSIEFSGGQMGLRW